MQQSMSPTMRALARRRTGNQDGKQMNKEEKVYREIMGTDGKIKAQFEHWLIDLEIDNDDILDK